MLEINGETFRLLLPEIILTITVVWLMVGGAFVRSGSLWTVWSLLGLIAAAVALLRTQGVPVGEHPTMASGPIVIDALSGLMRG